jgi:RNA polymerase sigma-70 factor (ECF subfamily)
MGPSLASMLLTRGRQAGEDLAELEQALELALGRAEAAFPDVSLGREAFVAHLARWLPPDRPARLGLDTLHVEELYVTCAAAAGLPGAIAAIEARYFDKARAALARNPGMASVADEALQRVREALFVGTAKRPPKIGEYSGRGDLGRWIRTTAMRTAMDLLSPVREIAVSDEAISRFPLPDDDPAIELMKREYGASFKQALHEALAELPRQTRHELRLYYVEGRGVEQIGAMYGIAASTVSRRLDKARRLLRERTRAALARHLRVGDDELDSILRMIATRLDVSRSAIAGPDHDEAADA